MTEVEIKRSWQDFLNDFKKHTTHDEGKVMWKYFAVPNSLFVKVCLYLCDNERKDWGVIEYFEDGSARIARNPNNIISRIASKKLFLEEKLAIARLGCMRIWSLKEKLNKQ